MYGIVNKAIESLITENYGEEIWEQICLRSGVEVTFFISNEPYDDAITYQLATAAAEILGISVSEVLIAFGEWWILRTGKEKYGSLMEAGGTHLLEFLRNLPAFHNRVMLMYPKLTPPEFRVSHETARGIYVHYISQRVGLQEFVRGLLQGLGKLYNTPITLTLLESRDTGAHHEIFAVTW